MIDAIVKIAGSILCLGLGMALFVTSLIVLSSYIITIRDKFEGK